MQHTHATHTGKPSSPATQIHRTPHAQSQETFKPTTSSNNQVQTFNPYPQSNKKKPEIHYQNHGHRAQSKTTNPIPKS